MNKNIIWNEEMDKAYGKIQYFNSEIDFIKEVQESHIKIVGVKCDIGDISQEHCISTKEGLEANSLLPISQTDTQIIPCYVAEIINKEDN